MPSAFFHLTASLGCFHRARRAAFSFSQLCNSVWTNHALFLFSSLDGRSGIPSLPLTRAHSSAIRGLTVTLLHAGLSVAVKIILRSELLSKKTKCIYNFDRDCQRAPQRVVPFGAPASIVGEYLIPLFITEHVVKFLNWIFANLIGEK